MPGDTSSPAAFGASYSGTVSRFDQAAAAARYATRHGGHPRDRREQSAIRRALAGTPAGSKVLDLPCGTGRLLPLLHRLGYDITEADYSAHMVEQARRLWQDFLTATPDASGTAVAFETQDVMKTAYTDGIFDAVICNRLFHHFTESSTRICALAELRRISRGPVIVSFFDSATLGAKAKNLMNLLRGRAPNGRLPIPMAALLADARAAGLALDGVFRTRGRISPQTYIRLRRI